MYDIYLSNSWNIQQFQLILYSFIGVEYQIIYIHTTCEEFYTYIFIDFFAATDAS